MKFHCLVSKLSEFLMTRRQHRWSFEGGSFGREKFENFWMSRNQFRVHCVNWKPLSESFRILEWKFLGISVNGLWKLWKFWWKKCYWDDDLLMKRKIGLLGKKEKRNKRKSFWGKKAKFFRWSKRWSEGEFHLSETFVSFLENFIELKLPRVESQQNSICKTESSQKPDISQFPMRAYSKARLQAFFPLFAFLWNHILVCFLTFFTYTNNNEVLLFCQQCLETLNMNRQINDTKAPDASQWQHELML
jgi:hypothetical protein